MRLNSLLLVPRPDIKNAAGSLYIAGAVFSVLISVIAGHAQPRRAMASATRTEKSFALTHLGDLVVTGGKAEIVDYLGRRAVRLTTSPKSEQVFAFLKGAQMQDGTIEADIAIKITTPPGIRMPGYVGIAFRASTDASHYDMFYLRPGNSRSEDQAMRNHSVQYVAAPGYDWYRLRREWPWVYEAYANLQSEHWNRIRILVRGRMAKLYVNAAKNPSLIVNGLKGELLQGGIALWGYADEEAYFSHVRFTPAEPENVENGSGCSGIWAVEFATDYGKFKGTLNLKRNGNIVNGTWSGAFGRDLPVKGSWRDGYVELTFDGSWPQKQLSAKVTLAGWVDGSSAKGRMKIAGLADGRWTAERAK